MMYGYGAEGVLGGVSIFGLLISLVVFVDLVLLGVFLWKKIK